MRLVLIAAATLIATPALAQQDRPPAYINAETCLRENVRDAVRVSNGAADAADFLLKYICAGPVGAASAYEMNTASLEAMRGMVDSMNAMTAGMEEDYAAADETYVTAEVAGGAAATDETTMAESTDAEISPFSGMADMFEGLSVDPVTGQMVVEPGSKGAAMAGAARAQGQAMDALLSNTAPIFLRELAGRLVLEHRR